VLDNVVEMFMQSLVGTGFPKKCLFGSDGLGMWLCFMKKYLIVIVM
jgi:hypothetical protein